MLRKYQLVIPAILLIIVASSASAVEYDLNTVVLSPLVPADQVFMEYLTERYGPGTLAGSALVWRVRP